jgi:hypothetical protein
MNVLNLPTFDIPELSGKKISLKAYDAWNVNNLRHSVRPEQRERRCQDPTHAPRAHTGQIRVDYATRTA